MTSPSDAPAVHETARTPEAHQAHTATAVQNSAPEQTLDQSLVQLLRRSIDKSGRYSYRLNDMAAGYAAGGKISFADARQGIEQTFTEEFGMSPHQYLDRHYAARRDKAHQNSKEQDASRSQKMDHER